METDADRVFRKKTHRMRFVFLLDGNCIGGICFSLTDCRLKVLLGWKNPKRSMFISNVFVSNANFSVAWYHFVFYGGDK